MITGDAICFWKTSPSHLQQVVGTNVAPGTITVDILESGRPEHYWQSQVQPSSGTVRDVLTTEFRDYSEERIPTSVQEPAGAGGCSEKRNLATSPDGQFVAKCESEGRSVSDHFQIKDSATSTTLYSWKTDDWREILGFAWSPNSHSVAVLNMSEYYGKSPVELLSALSGHPVPHNTIFLDVIDLQKGRATEYVIKRNVISAFCRILSWSS